MIGKSMESWPTQALQNVADARSMCSGAFYRLDVGCLLSIAFGDSDGAVAFLGEQTMWAIVDRFDALAGGYLRKINRKQLKRIPVDTLRIMCANRARRILARRHLSSLPPSPVLHGSAEGAVRA